MVSEKTVEETQTKTEDIEATENSNTNPEKSEDTAKSPPNGLEKEKTATEEVQAQTLTDIPNGNSPSAENESINPTNNGKVENGKNSSENKSVQTSSESASVKKSKKKDTASTEEKKLGKFLFADNRIQYCHYMAVHHVECHTRNKCRGAINCLPCEVNVSDGV